MSMHAPVLAEGGVLRSMFVLLPSQSGDTKCCVACMHAKVLGGLRWPREAQ